MAALRNFQNIEEKQKSFSNKGFFIIDSKQQFERWFEIYNQDNKNGERINYIYRGMSEAKYKLYTSAQRQWICNDMKEWGNNGSYWSYIHPLPRFVAHETIIFSFKSG